MRQKRMVPVLTAAALLGAVLMPQVAWAQPPAWPWGAGAHLEGDWVYDPQYAAVDEKAWASLPDTCIAAQAEGWSDWCGGMWWNTYRISGPEGFTDLRVDARLDGLLQVDIASPGDEAMTVVRVVTALRGEEPPGDWGEAYLSAYFEGGQPFYDYDEYGNLVGIGHQPNPNVAVFDDVRVSFWLRYVPVNEWFVLEQELGVITSIWEGATAISDFYPTLRLERFVLEPGYSIQVIPEPATLALLALAGLALIGRRRR